MKFSSTRVFRFSPLALAALALSCGEPPAPPVMGPPEVSVMHPIRRETTDYLNYDGITRGVKQTEVRPRVSGYLEKITFKPDSQVQEGQPLFLIDQRPYQVAKQRAEADLAGKRALIDSSRAELDRVRKLAEQQAASEQERLNRQAAYDSPSPRCSRPRRNSPRRT
jgi:multidrug efflux pump subunit AcrA (membrane-fusion protein)